MGRLGTLVDTTGIDWEFQPHSKLCDLLATNVVFHYNAYKNDKADKNYEGPYFYIGGAGTGKSRHGTEFASSLRKAIELRLSTSPGTALYHELAQRLENAFAFHVSFENGTPFRHEEDRDPMNAIGIRMLHQLLGGDIQTLRDKYVASPSAIFELIAVTKNVDLYDDFTGILVIDGAHQARKSSTEGSDKESAFLLISGGYWYFKSEVANGFRSSRPSSCQRRILLGIITILR